MKLRSLQLHLFFVLVTTSAAFTTFTPFASSPLSSTRLFYTDDDNNNNNNNNNKKVVNHDSVRRTAIKGISVSPSGFLTLLETRSSSSYSSPNPSNIKKIILPVRMTATQKDAYATTSAESLTICQLLSGVDMAGAILSPDVLKHVVGLYCSSYSMEEDDDDDADGNDIDHLSQNQIIIEDELGLEMPIPNSYNEEEEECDDDNIEKKDDYANTQEFVHNFIKTSLGTNTNSFEEASMYQRNRVIFPKISLDSIRIDLPMTMTTGVTSILSSTESFSTASTALWKDIVMDKVSTMQQEKNDNSDNFETNGGGLLAPLPLQFVLECRIDGDKKLDIPLYSEIDTITKYSLSKQQQDKQEQQGNDLLSTIMTTIEDSRSILQQVLYSYDDSCSASFLSMALALRYKCPIVISSNALDAIESLQTALEEEPDSLSICIQQIVNNENVNSENNDDENMEDDDSVIQTVLPQWRSTDKIQNQSQRVVENIEQGFQLTKLQGALKIALQRGDDIAAEKIRAEIEKLMGN